MIDYSEHLAAANKTLSQDLASLEQMTDVFSKVFELDIAVQAKRVRSQLQKVTELYFHETWDSSEVITASLDLVFSELEYETSEFNERVKKLDKSVNELGRIYEQFVLSQMMVMLVSSLEVYLSTVFKSCLSDKVELNERAILQIIGQFNFQNWGSSVRAFRTFFEIELCPPGVKGPEIDALLQKRHVLVHRMGTIDERAVRQLNLSPSSIGKYLRINPSEIVQGIKLVRRISEHLSLSMTRH